MEPGGCALQPGGEAGDAELALNSDLSRDSGVVEWELGPGGPQRPMEARGEQGHSVLAGVLLAPCSQGPQTQRRCVQSSV